MVYKINFEGKLQRDHRVVVRDSPVNNDGGHTAVQRIWNIKSYINSVLILVQGIWTKTTKMSYLIFGNSLITT